MVLDSEEQVTIEYLFKDVPSMLLKWTLDSILWVLSYLYIPIDLLITSPLESILSSLLSYLQVANRPKYWYELMSSPTTLEVRDVIITILSLLFAVQMFVWSYQVQTQFWDASYQIALFLERIVY